MADIRPLAQSNSALATSVTALKKVCIQYLDTSEEVCSNFQAPATATTPSNSSVYFAREALTNQFPGVIFEGDSILIGREVLLAPGTIIRALDHQGLPTQIVIEGESVLGNGVFLNGNIRLKNTQIQSGTKVLGSVQIQNSKVGPRLNIDGNRINIYESTIEDSILGTHIVLVQATLGKGGSITGSYVTLYPETAVDKPILGSHQHISTEKNPE